MSCRILALTSARNSLDFRICAPHAERNSLAFLRILVSVVKLSDMAEIVPGLALWSFGLLILIIAAAEATLDRRRIWLRVEELS